MQFRYNPLAIVGLIATVVTAVLLTEATLSQQLVNAVVRNYNNVKHNQTNVRCELADVGILTSTYDPTCNHYPGEAQGAFSQSTQDFWPVFPAINRFGAKSPHGIPSEFLQLGLTGAEYTNCHDYMTSAFNNVTAFGKVVRSVFVVVNPKTIASQKGNPNTAKCAEAVTTWPDNIVAPMTVTDPNCGELTKCNGLSMGKCFDMFASSFNDPIVKTYLSILSDILVNKCPAVNADTQKTCFDGYWFWSSIYAGFPITEKTKTMSAADYLPTLIQKCEDNTEDRHAMNFAKNMLLIAIGIAWTAVIVALFTTFYNCECFWSYRWAHLVPAVIVILAVLAAVLGLMRVNGSPIAHALSGKTVCEDWRLCYLFGASLTESIASIIAGLAAVILYICACFFFRPKNNNPKELELANPEEIFKVGQIHVEEPQVSDAV